MSEDNARYRPMQQGAQVGGITRISEGYKKGTLTCFVESYAQPRPGSDFAFPQGNEPKWEKFWITCSHVLSSGGNRVIGEPICQPAVLMDAFYVSHAGFVRCQVFGGKADAAPVYLNDEAVSSFSVARPAYTGDFNDKILQSGTQLTKIGPLFDLDRVKMYGMESGTIEGTAHGDYTWSQSGADLQGFRVTSDSDLQQGDSGGPVFKDTGELVGIITGADEKDFRLVRCCYVQNVLDALSNELTNWYNSTKPGTPATEQSGWQVGLRLASG